MTAILKEHDCFFVREGNGDHEVWESPITGKRFTVDKGGKNRHTANGALKTAGIDKKV
ncbi:MAG: type II toxin-antitoxin system HicA family toxin [Hyphomonadaceae bacterium]